MPGMFPKLEPQARTIAEAYLDECQRLGFTGLDGQGTPSKGHRKEIAAGARDFVEQVGEKPSILRKTIRKMRKEGLLLKNPRSCIAIAREFDQWGDDDSPEATRERYLGGEFADAIEH